MLISCPNCKFSREIDDAQVPDWAKALKCPQCGQAFSLKSNSQLEWLSELPSSNTAVEPDEISDPQIVIDSEKGIEDKPDATVTASPTPSEKEETTEQHADSTVPWESRQSDLLSSSYATVKMVMFKPGLLFKNMSPNGGYGLPITFVIALGYISVFLVYIMQLGLRERSGDTYSLQLPFIKALFSGDILQNGFLFFLAIVPLIYPLFLFVHAGLIHNFIPKVGRKHLGIQTIYRVLSYGSSPYWFLFIPRIGVYLTFFWSLISTIIGLSQVSRASTIRVISAAVMPFLLYGAVAYMIVPILW